MDFSFHTRLSTWLVVASILITAFAAFPSWPSFWIHVFNIFVLVLVLFVAHGEGRQDEKHKQGH
jgi:hypothetical protein